MDYLKCLFVYTSNSLTNRYNNFESTVTVEIRPATTNVICYVFLILLVITSVVLKIIHVKLEGNLKRDSRYFQHYGITLLVFEIIALLIHPIYKVGDVKLSFAKESYYDSDSLTFQQFRRDFNSYLIFLAIIVHFMNFLMTVPSFTVWHSSKSYRVCKTYRTSNLDPLFVVRAILNTNPLHFTFFLLVSFSVFFTMIVSVVENGYLRDISDLNCTGSCTVAEQQNSRAVFYSFNNIFWNVFITFTTIGIPSFSSAIYLIFNDLTLFYLFSSHNPRLWRHQREVILRENPDFFHSLLRTGHCLNLGECFL